MGNYALQANIGLDLDRVLSSENRKGLELIMGLENASDKQVIEGYVDFIYEVLEKSLSKRLELNGMHLNIIDHGNYDEDSEKIEEDGQTFIEEVDDETVNKMRVLNAPKDSVIDLNELSKVPFVQRLCDDLIELTGQTAVIKSIIYDNEIETESIEVVLKEILGIENKIIVENNSFLEIDEIEYSIGYELLGEMKQLNKKRQLEEK